jgi:hypothetical protein
VRLDNCYFKLWRLSMDGFAWTDALPQAVSYARSSLSPLHEYTNASAYYNATLSTTILLPLTFLLTIIISRLLAQSHDFIASEPRI